MSRHFGGARPARPTRLQATIKPKLRPTKRPDSTPNDEETHNTRRPRNTCATVQSWVQGVRRYCQERNLAPPPGLEGVEAALSGTPAAEELYRPLSTGKPPDLDWAFEEVARGASGKPGHLLPLLPVDAASFACVVCPPAGESADERTGQVVRRHLGDIPARDQDAVLDVDATKYAASVADELKAREEGMRRVYDDYGPKYRAEYLSEDGEEQDEHSVGRSGQEAAADTRPADGDPAEPGARTSDRRRQEQKRSKRPRAHVRRPVRLACQNVVVALAAFAHDSSFDGLRVDAWQTCEVPHLGAHEATRALAALTLCDAFQNGGTMEIRFRRHPERAVPASLKRFARTRGFELGAEAPGAITPAEARDLFIAVTPMTDELRKRSHQASAARIASPERLCFTLLAGIWTAIEVEFMLATTPRVGQILEGGSSATMRADRQAETDIARAAAMLGILHRRLRAVDPAGGKAGEVRVLEDQRTDVTWSVVDELGTARLAGSPAGPLPWGAEAELSATQGLVVLPRPVLQPEDVAMAALLAQADDVVAFVLPADADDHLARAASLPVLRCPSRLDELDRQIDAKLLTARVTRA